MLISREHVKPCTRDIGKRYSGRLFWHSEAAARHTFIGFRYHKSDTAVTHSMSSPFCSLPLVSSKITSDYIAVRFAYCIHFFYLVNHQALKVWCDYTRKFLFLSLSLPLSLLLR